LTALHTLPEIAAEADGMTVMLDGGIRRGTDVLKALALGDMALMGIRSTDEISADLVRRL
jgi:L-lactate dehydrogenase (cytochrome)